MFKKTMPNYVFNSGKEKRKGYVFFSKKKDSKNAFTFRSRNKMHLSKKALQELRIAEIESELMVTKDC